MGAIITLTTDFGLEDAFVGMMKGVILGINPGVTIVDLCHLIPPQDIAGAAFLIHTSHRYFPPGTIHVVIVDPGVGGQRRAVALQTPLAAFVAPDNGLLSYVVREMSQRQAPYNLVHLDRPSYWLPHVSATFHGRDIFAPVAAYLSTGVLLSEMGEPIQELVMLPRSGPLRQGEVWFGRVTHVDYFGNLITDFTPEEIQELRPGATLQLSIGSQVIQGLKRTYSEGCPGCPMALIGSLGYLEIAIPNGNAAQSLGAGVGTPVRLEFK